MDKRYFDIYKDTLDNSVIPFWLKHSPDEEYGGTFCCLDRDGTVYDDKKYVWLMGRSVWMFSKLYNEYEKNEEYLNIAKLGVDFIDKYASDKDGKYYFSLTRDGRPYFFQRKPYSAVFCMLAYLQYGKATASSEYIEKAEKLFWTIDSWMKTPGCLGRPAYDNLPKFSTLADIMVMASMAAELATVEVKQSYLDVMTDSIAMLEPHFVPEHKILMENVSIDDSDVSSWPEGRFVCPGSAIETAWFIIHLLDYIPDNGVLKRQLDIIEGSLEYGWDKEYGGIYYFMDSESKPTLQLESSMKLWWPHTEAVYACLLAYKKTGDGKWLDWHKKVHDYTFEHFFDTEHGGAFGYCDRMGNLTNTCKGGNYKGFFHVPRFLLLNLQLFEQDK